MLANILQSCILAVSLVTSRLSVHNEEKSITLFIKARQGDFFTLLCDFFF